jgi:hypothetical protein
MVGRMEGKHMEANMVIPVLVIIILMVVCNKNVAMYISHILNNIFGLPHPGPEDIQGSCWCRRHEGPEKYSFRDYIKHILTSGKG